MPGLVCGDIKAIIGQIAGRRLAGLPAVTIRGRSSSDRLVIGLRVITDYAKQRRAVRIGRYLEKEMGVRKNQRCGVNTCMNHSMDHIVGRYQLWKECEHEVTILMFLALQLQELVMQT